MTGNVVKRKETGRGVTSVLQESPVLLNATLVNPSFKTAAGAVIKVSSLSVITGSPRIDTSVHLILVQN